MDNLSCLKVLENAAIKAGKHALESWGSVYPEDVSASEGWGDAIQRAEKFAFSKIDSEVQVILMEEISLGLEEILGKNKKINIVVEESTVRTKSLAEVLFSRFGFEEGKYCVIIDPIDGSRNYLSATPNTTYFKDHNHRSKFWGVSVAITHGREIIAMAVYYPALNLTLTSAKGFGTKINGKIVKIEDGRPYSEQDFVRISGSVQDSEALRKLFKDDLKKTPGSLVTTILSMFNGKHLVSNNLVPYKAYIGDGGAVYDLAGLPLAYIEAGGKILDLSGKDFNPYDDVFEDNGALRHRGMFIMTPSKKYALPILEKINIHRDESPLDSNISSNN